MSGNYASLDGERQENITSQKTDIVLQVLCGPDTLPSQASLFTFERAEDNMTTDRIPLIFDTDLGEDIDDLYALYLALFHPQLNVVAVTTVHGDTLAKARLAAKVLRLAGRPDIPVGAGIGMSTERVARGQVRPDPAKAATFLRYLTQDDPEWNLEVASADDVIAQALWRSESPVALVAEGAMSNLASIIRTADTHTRSKMRCVAAMAGETQAVWNEYNVICDPEAADYVLASGLPVFLGTHHLTAQLVMTMDEVDREFGRSDRQIHRVLYDCTMLWAPHRGRKPGPVLYDLVPLFWLADPRTVQTRQSTVRVELDGKYTRGQTVRLSGDDGGKVIESVNLNPSQLVHDFLAVINAAKTD